MSTIRTTYKFKCDMDKGTLETSLRNSLMQADALADAFAVTVQRNGEDVDISGMTVYGYLYANATKTTVLLKGTISGSTATVILSEDCYAVPGYASLMIQLHDGDVRHTVLKVDFVVTRTGGTLVIDGDNILPTLAELLGQISAMEQATAEARAATAVANQAVDNVEAFKGEIQVDITALSEEIKDKTDYLSVITNEHFRPIPYTFRTKGNYYREVDGEVIVQGQLASSGIIPAPKNLCFDFGAENLAKCFLYFYTQDEGGEYVLTFEPYNTITSNNLKNYIGGGTLESRMIRNIPDDTYMEICFDEGMVKLFGWDGVPFGMDVCATCSIPTTDNEEVWLFANGDSGITVPGKATHIISDGAVMRLVHGYKNGERFLLSGATKSYYKLPGGYDYFRIRIKLTVDDGKLKTLSGDVRNLFHIVATKTEEVPISNAVKVIKNAERICSLSWVPQWSFRVNSNTTITYKSGVEYNGLPYSGDWEIAHFVGWHVSPHTFVNAMNDSNSIARKKTAGEGGKEEPYYGIVCSAFATMCDGWECPQTNAGYFYDPEIETYYSHNPPLGQIYTDITSHCVIPAGITQIADDTMVSAYESIRPISTKTTRFMSIAYQDVWQWWNAAAGLDYYNNYGYVVHNPKAKPDMSTVPYADFAGAKITGGSARPYKGDKSVYTSAEDEVLINIKNDTATLLYFEVEDGSIQQIAINGKSVIDVKPYLLADGIYYVYTDVDATKESFEYVTVVPISCGVKDNSIEFSDNDFWYADCNFAGIHYYQNGMDESGNPTYEKRNVSVMANARGDYSKWFKNGNWITSVNAIFRKGRYGAYTVPIAK